MGAAGRASSFALRPPTFPDIPGRNINEQTLNFALTLEILEADLYRQALNVASGLSITDALRSSSSDIYKLRIPPGAFSTQARDAAFAYLLEFAFVEAAHRAYLQTVLGSLGATAVTANPDGYAFPGGPGVNLKQIITNIIPLEETGVRAYLGALPAFTLDTLATAAGGIYSTEARHSAVLNTIVGNDPGPHSRPGDLRVAGSQRQNTFEYYLEPGTVLSDASVYLVM
jgi:hypothetical protein